MSTTHVCPWRSGYTLNNRMRRILHRPENILKELVLPGKTVMDIGCGMGFFTLPMARLVGKTGKVIAIDLQPQMLRGMEKCAEKANVTQQITSHLCGQESLGIDLYSGTVDFALLFMMLHEVPDPVRLIRELHTTLSTHGRILFAEPVIHVSRHNYQKSLDQLAHAGFLSVAEPAVALCRAAVLQKVS